MCDVFLSYCSDDRVQAKRVAKALEEAGLSVWWDRHLLAGSRLESEIEEKLQASRTVVVLWSQRALDRAWVQAEAAEAAATGKLIPCRLDRCTPPLLSRSLKTLDLDPLRRSTSEALVRSVRERLDAPPPPRLRHHAKQTFLAIGVLALSVATVGIWGLRASPPAADAFVSDPITPVQGALPGHCDTPLLPRKTKCENLPFSACHPGESLDHFVVDLDLDGFDDVIASDGEAGRGPTGDTWFVMLGSGSGWAEEPWREESQSVDLDRVRISSLPLEGWRVVCREKETWFHLAKR